MEKIQTSPILLIQGQGVNQKHHFHLWKQIFAKKKSINTHGLDLSIGLP